VRQFARDTESLIRQIGLRTDDLFFLPGAGEIELEGLARSFARRRVAASATWHLLFRRDPPSPDASGGLHARLLRALRRIEPEYRAGRVRLYTDTDDLSREYERLGCVGDVLSRRTQSHCIESGRSETASYGRVHFRTLPIPHTDSGPIAPRVEETGTGTSPNTTTIAALPLGSEPVPVPSRPLHVLYLGDARREKGYHHLPRIVADLWDDCLAAGRITMTIQSNPALTDDEPAIAAARERLRSYASSAITLVDEPLSSAAYRRLLHSGDLILLPYDPQAYRWRSSGILVEALAAGIPAIVPAETWLARQLLVDVGAVYHDVWEIPALIRRIVGDYGRYVQASQAFAPGWRAKHNAASLVQMLARGFGIDTS
jgi:glycosyltransferase involved in cell wall biosynthesis